MARKTIQAIQERLMILRLFMVRKSVKNFVIDNLIDLF